MKESEYIKKINKNSKMNQLEKNYEKFKKIT